MTANNNIAGRTDLFSTLDFELVLLTTMSNLNKGCKICRVFQL